MSQTYVLNILLIILLNSFFLVTSIDHDEFNDHHTEQKQQQQRQSLNPNTAPAVSPHQAPHSHNNDVNKLHEPTTTSSAHQTTMTDSTEAAGYHGHEPIPAVHLKEAHHTHHHNVDKSVAGGGVIIAGLATAFVVAIFCYIRATRRTRQAIMSKEQLI